MALTALVLGACGVTGPTGGSGDPAPSPDLAARSSPPPAASSGECRGWAISLASTGVTGADTPEAAANSTRFGLPPEYVFEATTWATTSSRPPMIWLSQEKGSLEVTQLPDGTWYVTAGSRCD